MWNAAYKLNVATLHIKVHAFLQLNLKPSAMKNKFNVAKVEMEAQRRRRYGPSSDSEDREVPPSPPRKKQMQRYCQLPPLKPGVQEQAPVGRSKNAGVYFKKYLILGDGHKFKYLKCNLTNSSLTIHNGRNETSNNCVN